MKVKNIMFFGFAAAILSAAGAVASPISNATDRQIVTSKAYVDSKVTAINSDISSKADRDLGNLTSTTVIDGRVNSQAAGAEFTSSVTGLTQASTIQGAIEAAAGIANGALVAADIVEGDTAGAIEVDGTAVPVHGLATVATSGDYDDLTDKPDLTLKANTNLGNLTNEGTAVITNLIDTNAAGADFTSSVTGLTQASTIQGAIEAAAGIANGALVAADIVEGDTAGAIEVDGTAVPVHGLATVATSGAYSDLTGTPTVGDSNLTITDKDNNTIVFGANATSPVSGTLKTVPAKPNTCTDTNPCALITLDSGEYDWVQMAQPSNN